MAEVAAAASSYETNHVSSYRVKFEKDAFLDLVKLARPKRIYRRGKNTFFGFDGFVMYSQECEDSDFPGIMVIEAIELSNYSWQT